MKDYSATTGTAIQEDDTPAAFHNLALDRITPSLTNPRKTFDPAKLQDLADSIRASGVHQPRSGPSRFRLGEDPLTMPALTSVRFVPVHVPLVRCPPATDGFQVVEAAVDGPQVAEPGSEDTTPLTRR